MDEQMLRAAHRKAERELASAARQLDTWSTSSPRTVTRALTGVRDVLRPMGGSAAGAASSARAAQRIRGAVAEAALQLGEPVPAEVADPVEALAARLRDPWVRGLFRAVASGRLDALIKELGDA